MCLSEKARNELERLSAATTTDVDGDPNLQTPDLPTAFFPFRFSKSLKLPESFARSLLSVRRRSDGSLQYLLPSAGRRGFVSVRRTQRSRRLPNVRGVEGGRLHLNRSFGRWI